MQRKYSKSEYERDLRKFENMEKGKSPLDLSSFKRLMIYELCTNTDILTSHKIGIYPIETIQNALMNPSIYFDILIETSRYLENIQFYKRLNAYFSKMGLFNYIIDIYDVKTYELDSQEKQNKLRDSFTSVCSEFEKINLKHEMSKIMNILLVEDLYYGLIFEDNTDFFILKINPQICKIAQIQDGVYNFKINLSEINPLEINSYPDYLQQAYIDYRNSVNYLDGWFVPPADKQICFKFNESCFYPMPFMISLVQDILDLDIYKNLKLQKARVDNYKAIIVEVPLDKDSVDKPLLSEETLMSFAEMNKENMPEDVGLIHAPGNAEAISFKDNTNTTNNLSDAISNIYDNAGIPKELFNGSSSGTALTYSIENDAAIIYRFYRQCERYFNRLIKLRKYNKPAYKFALRIHDSTVFNRDKIADSFLKASQHGLPFKMDYGVALGKSQSRIMGSLFLENDIFELHTKFIPLSTSYTTTSEDITSGRPTNESKGELLDDSGEQTANNDSNAKR